MIKVAKDFSTPPKILNKKSCYNKTKKAVKSKNGSVYKGYYYRHEQVTTELKAVYNKKCAYCESFSEHVAALQVEHYRPKAKVDDKQTPSPNGYYWLGCEWSNLLLACSKCNGRSAKANNFPIQGPRVYDANPIDEQGDLDRNNLFANKAPLIEEKPLLLNPEIDNPEEHLTFQYLGKIKGLSEKGEISIKIYTLNRDDLVVLRQKIVDEYVEQLKVILLKANRNDYTPTGYQNTLKELFEKIEYTNVKTQDYILWRWHIFNNFSASILSRINESYRPNIEKAFNKYKRGLL